MENTLLSLSQPSPMIHCFEKALQDESDQNEPILVKSPAQMFLKHHHRKIKSGSLESLESEESNLSEASLVRQSRSIQRKLLFRSDPSSAEFTEKIEKKQKEIDATSFQIISNSLKGHFVFKNLDKAQMYIF